MAFAMTFSLAVMLVIIRVKKWSPSFLQAAVDIAARAMAELALFGVVQFGLGLILFTIDARLITPLQVSLLNRLQTVLGPVWVWLAFGRGSSTDHACGWIAGSYLGDSGNPGHPEDEGKRARANI